MDCLDHPAPRSAGTVAGLTRRHALALAGSGLVLPALLTAPARAELVIDLRKGTFQPMPIAVADFAGEGGGLVSGIIANNLKRCGYFLPIEKARHPEKNPPFDAAPQFEAWKAAGVQALVIGRVSRDGGRLRAEFRLWDVVAGQQIDGQQYFTDPNNSPPRRPHHI
jgi:TolB protein